MSSVENKSVISHKFGQNKEEKKITKDEKSTNNPPSPSDGEDTNTTNKDSTIFINETDFSEVLSCVGSTLKSLLKEKLVNNQQKNIPIDGLVKMVNWLALSTEVLKGNKNVVKYNMNTMTNSEAKATGVVEIMDQGTVQGEVVSTHNWSQMKILYDRQAQTANASVGFPALHKEIDELLVQRLTDSIGKQSPINGKVLDIKSIINANVLPVIKNGNIDYTHRILETACQMLNILNIQAPTSNISGVYRHYTTEDLEYQDVRQDLETLTNSSTQIKDITLALKSVNPVDMMNEVKANLRGAFQLLDPSNCVVRTYGLHKLDASSMFTTTRKYDSSPLARKTGYTGWRTIPLFWLRNDPGNTVIWVTDSEDGDYWVLTFTSANNCTTVNNWIQEDLSRVESLLSGTSVTINGTAYTYTKNDVYGTLPCANLCAKVQVPNYVAFENYADIINAIDLLSYVTAKWNYYSATNTKSVTNLARSTRDTRMFVPSSIWARIAMLYGQIKYLKDCERNIGNETLISNKIFNYSYYLAGSRAKLAQNTYGSFKTVQDHMPSLVYPSFCNADRILKFHHEHIQHYVPLLNYSASVNKSEIVVGYVPNTATGYLFAEYFTDPRWWRYDYFGNLRILAPSQRLSANQDDQEYSADDNLVFTNVGLVTENVAANIGTATFRFTANGQYVPISLQAISYSPNTCLKLDIPNIFTIKKRTKCMLIHGMDLAYRSAPIWYGYYDYVRTMVDDGSFEEDILDELF